jgi:capsular exopolysaccharide synthesis family protein
MSRLYEALQKSSAGDANAALASVPGLTGPAATVREAEVTVTGLNEVATLAIPARPEHRLVALWEERGGGAERIRTLATRLKHLQQRRSLKKLLITSCVQSEGKSVIAANVAITLARRGSQRVLLVDGDSRQPMLTEMMGLRNQPGLADAWQERQSIIRYLRRYERFPLWFLPAGRVLEQPLEMLQSESLPSMMSELNGCFDWIIIDSAPVAPVADSSVWAVMCDGALLVVRSGVTPKKVLGKAAASLEKGKLIGVVLNDCSDPSQHYYSQYYKPNGQKTPGQAS